MHGYCLILVKENGHNGYLSSHFHEIFHRNIWLFLLFQEMAIKNLQSAPISQGPSGNRKQAFFRPKITKNIEGQTIYILTISVVMII